MEKEQLIERLEEIIKKPGGKQAARFALNSLGGIPFVGGAFAATSDLWGEKEQQEFNEKLIEWASKTNFDIDKIIEHLSTELKEPTKANMALLIGEVLELDLPDSYPLNGILQVATMLHGESVQAFQPYINNGWMKLTSNGNVTNMGAGNIAGSSIEDKKRPWGMGNGFVLSIEKQYYE